MLAIRLATVAGPNSGDRPQYFGPAGKPFIGSDRGANVPVKRRNAGGETAQVQFHLPQAGLGFEFRGQLPQFGAFVDESPADQHEVLELTEALRRRRRRLQAVQTPQPGQHRRIDAIRLGKLAERLGETPSAGRLHQNSLAAACGKALVQPAVVAAGRFEDRAAHPAPLQPLAQGAAAELRVLEAARQVERVDVDVEPLLAHIDAGNGL